MFPITIYIEIMSEVTLTTANFDAEVKQSSVPVLVDFWAPWCGPCKILGPVIEEIAKEYEGKPVKIAKLNVDDNQEIAQQYGVMSIPTLMLFKNGNVEDQMMGAQPKEKIDQLLRQYL